MKRFWAGRQLALAACIAAMAFAVAACGDDSTSGSGGSASGAAVPAKLTKLSFQTFPQTMGTFHSRSRGSRESSRRTAWTSRSPTARPARPWSRRSRPGRSTRSAFRCSSGMQSVLAGAKIKALVGLVGGGGSVVFVSDRVPRVRRPVPRLGQGARRQDGSDLGPRRLLGALLKRYVDGARAPR